MKDLIDALAGRIAVVGDFMLDKYIRGSVHRISPESPVPVVEYVSEHFTLGGAGNVVLNVNALGGSPLAFGFVGDDDAGQKIVRALESDGAGRQGILVDAGRPTTVKTRIIAQHQQLLRIDSESRAAVADELRAEMLKCLTNQLPVVGAVVISDYNKGALSRSFFDDIVRACRAAGVSTILDPKAFDLNGVGPVTIITPNEKEAERYSGCPVYDPRSAEIAGRKLLDSTGAENVLVTLGEHGMTLFSQTGEVTHMPAVSKEVYDVTGAGDTVVATLALALAAGATASDAARLANIAAGIVVGKVGTATISRDELRSAVDGHWPATVPSRRSPAVRAATVQ